MMDEVLKHQFIACRASGMSFDRIAEKLKVSKPTLVNWSRECSLEIENLKASALDALREKFVLTTQKRLELLGELLERLKQEALARDLSTLPSHKLLELTIKYSDTVKEATPPVEFKQKEARPTLAENLKELESGEIVVSWEV